MESLKLSYINFDKDFNVQYFPYKSVILHLFFIDN